MKKVKCINSNYCGNNGCVHNGWHDRLESCDGHCWIMGGSDCTE